MAVVEGHFFVVAVLLARYAKSGERRSGVSVGDDHDDIDLVCL